MTYPADANSAADCVTENLLSDRQLQIVERAVAHVKPRYRDDFKKYVFDILRGQREPRNTEIRSAVCQALQKFRRPN